MHTFSVIIRIISERRTSIIDSKAKAVAAARASLEKKAADVLVLELTKLTAIADYFVLCSAENTQQVKAIASQIEESLKKPGIKPIRIEGMEYAHWVLLDYGDVIIHIFEAETRAYYELEKFWLDAPRVPFDEEDSAALGRQDKRSGAGRAH
ncbi:MAG TPA: ribosome silencing factor [Dissulfurispiraceae bacterium]|nr:ribosome silencing factor [Dissulfurispiraceae bacterium]